MEKTYELIKEISEKYDQKDYLIKFWMKAITDSISKVLIDGNTITIKNFGIFKLRKIKARNRKNLKSGESFFDEEYTAPKFYFSKKIRAEIRKKHP